MPTPDSAPRRIWRAITTRSELYGGMRLIDILPALPIGLALVIFFGPGWTVLAWFGLSFVSMCLTNRFVRSADDNS